MFIDPAQFSRNRSAYPGVRVVGQVPEFWQQVSPYERNPRLGISLPTESSPWQTATQMHAGGPELSSPDSSPAVPSVAARSSQPPAVTQPQQTSTLAADEHAGPLPLATIARA